MSLYFIHIFCLQIHMIYNIKATDIYIFQIPVYSLFYFFLTFNKIKMASINKHLYSLYPITAAQQTTKMK